MRLPERVVASLQEPVAQPVEHVTFNHGVLGSSPSGLTTQVSGSLFFIGFLQKLANRLLRLATLCSRFG
jgi:hypothetical protein